MEYNCAGLLDEHGYMFMMIYTLFSICGMLGRFLDFLDNICGRLMVSFNVTDCIFNVHILVLENTGSEVIATHGMVNDTGRYMILFSVNLGH